MSPKPQALAYRLGSWYEQPISDEEWDVLEQLETSSAEVSPYSAEVEIDCEQCGGSGVDPGGLHAYEPEDCRGLPWQQTANDHPELSERSLGDHGRPVQPSDRGATPDGPGRLLPPVLNAFAGKVAA